MSRFALMYECMDVWICNVYGCALVIACYWFHVSDCMLMTLC